MLGTPFLRSLVREIVSAEDDLEIVGELGAEPELLDAAASTDADFVIVAVREPSMGDVYLELLEQRPRMKVLAVDGDHHDACLWELRPHRMLLGQISAETLLGAIRSSDWRSVGVW